MAKGICVKMAKGICVEIVMGICVEIVMGILCRDGRVGNRLQFHDR